MFYRFAIRYSNEVKGIKIDAVNQRIIHFRDWQNQKKPFRGVLRKMCSENMQVIYRKAPMPSVILAWNFL